MGDRVAERANSEAKTKAGRRGEYSGPVCGALTRGSRKGGQCQRPAGWGTSHLGYGRCKLHGGSTRAQTAKALAEMAHDEMRKALGVPVLVRRLDRQTIRAVVLAVVDGLALGVEQQVLARELLEAEIAGLQTLTPEQAKRLQEGERRATRSQPVAETDFEATPADDAALDLLVHPTVIRRKKKLNRKDGSR